MKTKHLRLMQRAYVILFFCFMYLPIAYMVVFSFNQSKGYALFTGFTFKWYTSLLHNESILHALWVSLYLALFSAVIATVLGTGGVVWASLHGAQEPPVGDEYHLYHHGQPRDHHRYLPDDALCGIPALCV